MRASEIPEKMSDSYRHESDMPVVGFDEWAQIAAQALVQPNADWEKKATRTLKRIGQVVGDHGRSVRSAGHHLRENPWKAIALALAFGAAAYGGVLLRQHNGRRSVW